MKSQDSAGERSLRAPDLAHVRILALIYALGGSLSLASARWPLSPQSPVTLLSALGSTGLVVAVAVLVLGRRWPTTVIQTGFALLSVLVGLTAARSVTAVGVVGLGPVIISAAVYAAHAFTANAGRLQVACLISAAACGAALSPADAFVVPWVIVPVAASAVFEIHGALVRRLRALASSDPLTGVANRRAWQEAAARDLSQARRSGRQLSVVLIDLDGFKQVNDEQGHAAGDALLRELALRWSHELRRGDLLGRYGGDEFVLLLPGADRAEAAALLRRLRSSHPMAWSAGIASHAGPADSGGPRVAGRLGDRGGGDRGGGEVLDSLLARADSDLYARKRGRGTTAA